MFEKKADELLSRLQFAKRLVRCGLFAFLVVSLSLALGTVGYHAIAGFPWVDAFLNASMILTGMGPMGTLPNDAAKIFASFYALFSGIVFLTVMAISLTPILHRVLHSFHISEEDDGEGD